MPRRTDISSVLVIGSGPIVIGQACEFDYSGTQACRVLKAEGFRVILVNSNPATIMTDPEFADATYVEPITPEFVEMVIAKERPDALLATLGGHAEVARSRVCHSMTDVLAAAEDLGYPLVVRPSFTMGGVGSGLAHEEAGLRRVARARPSASPPPRGVVEESVLGWKEYELEVMRDRADNVVIVCSIENLDPMGVHTGDSITVAPAMTLTDREYQRMRDVAIGIIRAVGVDTGGCNIQFAIDPADGRMIVIEMNPRVSRSSALASKATGFPIAKIAAKVAIGYTLDDIVVKVPRFAFEKFPTADPVLTTHMKSVGEAMAIGRNFTEALQKALRSLESPAAPFDFRPLPAGDGPAREELLAELLSQVGVPHDGRLNL